MLTGKQAKNANIARTINKCLSQFTSSDMQLLESMVLTNFNDAMMTNNLAKLQMAQINLTEKINDLFIKSLNQYIQNQNTKFQNKQDGLTGPEPAAFTTDSKNRGKKERK